MKNRLRGEIYLISIRTYDDKNVIVKFVFEETTYQWVTSSHWKKASNITYKQYHEKFIASWNDEGMDNYNNNRIATNVRELKTISNNGC